MIAASHGHDEVLRMLLALGADAHSIANVRARLLALNERTAKNVNAWVKAFRACVYQPMICLSAMCTH